MGGSSSKQENYQQKSTSEPWRPTLPALGQTLNQINAQWDNIGLSGNEQVALNGLSESAQAGNPYAGKIGNLADELFTGGIDRTGMVKDAYSELRQGLLPYANSNTNPYENEAFTKATGYMSDDIMNRIKSQYAGAGYSPVSSGDFGKQVGEGISRGVAPTWLQGYENMEGRKLGAINTMYGAGNTTAGILSGMDQQALGNKMQAPGMARQAMDAQDAGKLRLIEIEKMRRGLPVENIAQLANLIIPMAQLGGTQNTEGQRNTQSTMSPVEQAQRWASTAASVFGAPAGGQSAAKGFMGGWS